MSSSHQPARKAVLLTVGSTSFSSLIGHALSSPSLLALRRQGYTELVLQYGRSTLPAGWSPSQDGVEREGIQVKLFDFRDGIEELYDDVELVISHAGAGSILTSLRAGKTLITVVNDSFADNHQSELALELGGRRHLLVSTPESLASTIDTLDVASLEPFPPPDPTALLRMIDQEAGYV